MGTPAATEPVVKDCKVLGLTSKNGRRYLAEAVGKAIPLYEGVGVYFDHEPTSEKAQARSFISMFGCLENMRQAEDGSARGDFRYNPKHVYAETFKGWLESNPKRIGFSHNAVGKVQEDADGTLVVEEIVSVESVDLVSRPATTEGLFEEFTPNKRQKKATRIKEMDEPLLPDPVDSPAEEGDHEEHLANAVRAIFADSSMSSEDKLKKIKALFKVLDADEPAEEKKEDDSPAEEKKTEEAHRLKALKKEVAALEEAMVGRVAGRVKELLAEAEARLDAKAKVKAPTSHAPVKAQPVLTVEDFLAGMR